MTAPTHLRRFAAPIATAAMLVALLLFPSASFAAFGTPLPLTDSAYADRPDAVTDATGTTHVVHYDYPTLADDDQLILRRISSAGVVSAPIVVAAGGSYYPPRIAVGADGVAHVVWLESGEIRYNRVFADDTVGTPITLDPAVPSNGTSNTIRVAADAGGGAHVVWAYPDPIPSPAAVAGLYVYVDGGVPEPVRTLSPQVRSYGQIDVAAGAAGVAEIVWPEMDGDNNVYAVTAVDGVLGTAAPLSADMYSEGPEVAIDGSGNTHYTWTESNAVDAVMYARRVGGVLQPTQTLTDGTLEVYGSVLATDAAGAAHVAWYEYDGNEDHAVYASIADGSTVSGQVTLSEPGDSAQYLRIAAGRAGQASIAWSSSNGGDTYGVRVSGGVAGVAEQLSDPAVGAEQPFVTGSVSGVASVGWLNGDYNVEVAVGVAPPSCDAASATVPQGQSVTINVSCDASPSSISVVSAPASGTVGTIDAAAGTIQYTAAASFTGTATFTFAGTNDGGAGAPATATVTVTAPPAPTTCPAGQTGTPPNCVTPTTTDPTCATGQTGTPPNCVTPTTTAPTCATGQIGTPPTCITPKTIVGGTKDDSFDGSDGDDSFTGGSGDEVFRAGPGGDTARGGGGSDRLYGSTGDDDFEGGTGNDKLFGGAGDDRLRGGAGNDEVHGNGGTDDVRGGLGNDKVSCGAGPRESAFGDVGNDIVSCLDRNAGDTVNGGVGTADVCIGDMGDRFVGCERILRVVIPRF